MDFLIRLHKLFGRDLKSHSE